MVFGRVPTCVSWPPPERASIRSIYGVLRTQIRQLSWEDFEEASRVAMEDVESGPTFPER
jgi:hypothetical protein